MSLFSGVCAKNGTTERASPTLSWQIMKTSAFSDADADLVAVQKSEETRLQSTHVPGTRFQQLKGQKSKTTSKTHSLADLHRPHR
jgi:3-mercaptopyruvate sulfurtransferase SseA